MVLDKFINLFESVSLLTREIQKYYLFDTVSEGQITISKVLPQCLLYEKHVPDQVFASLFLQWPH